MGPNIDPWGTLQLISTNFDFSFLNSTYSFLFVR